MGKQAQGVCDDVLQLDGKFKDFAAAGERAEVCDDADDALEGVGKVIEGFIVVILLAGGKMAAEGFQDVKGGVGIVQGIINFVDDARAHLAEGGEFFGADELFFFFLELDEGLAEVVVGKLEVALVFF